MRIVLRLTKLEIDALQGGQKEPVLVSEIEINEVLVDLGPRCNLIDPGTIEALARKFLGRCCENCSARSI